MNRRMWSYSDWLEMHFEEFLAKIDSDRKIWGGIISAHAHKCLQYKDTWRYQGVPFPHGCAIYLLTFLNPWASEVKQVDKGDWVAYNYERFKKILPYIDFDKVDPNYR